MRKPVGSQRFSAIATHTFYGITRIAATVLFRFDRRCVVPYYMNGRLDRGGARTTPLSRLPVPLLLVASSSRAPQQPLIEHRRAEQRPQLALLAARPEHRHRGQPAQQLLHRPAVALGPPPPELDHLEVRRERLRVAARGRQPLSRRLVAFI